MGGSYHNPDTMRQTRDDLRRKGIDPYAYSRDTLDRGGTIHPALDPAYGGLRVSDDPRLDAEDDRVAYPVSIITDVTGSNIGNARPIYETLPQFMELVTVQGWLKPPFHLNLQVGAVGDANSDKYPLQLSPFESDGETVDRWLTKTVLESGGGGQGMETYELMFWALTHQNLLSAWRRGAKGKVFIIFDEAPYPAVKASHLRNIYNARTSLSLAASDDISDGQRIATRIALPDEDIALDVIAAQLHARYDVWGIIGSRSDYFTNPVTLGVWQKLLKPEHLIKLDDPGEVPALVAAVLGQQNGIDRDVIKDTVRQIAPNSAKDIAVVIDKSLSLNSNPLVAHTPRSTRAVRL